LKKLILFLFLFSKCGFLNNTGTGFLGSTEGDGDPGTGKVPQLSQRRNVDQLKNQDCNIDEDCKRACQEIYDELHSYEDCYDLSYGDVADMQNIFRALTEEDLERQVRLLDKVDIDALELYLDVGINGFRDEAISQIEDYSERKENYKQILDWLIGSTNLVKIFQRKDPRNEILETLLVNFAKSASCRDITANQRNDISLDSGEMQKAGSGVIATVEASQEDLLKALTCLDSDPWNSSSSPRGNFFLYSAENTARHHAFLWAYELIEETCSNNHRDLAHQCIAGVLCWFRGTSENRFVLVLNNDDSQIKPEIKSELSAGGCNFQNAL